MSKPNFDTAAAQRWFAVELNNRLWAALEEPRWSAEEAEQHIHAAHASCYHWMQAGSVANHARAEVLVANVYAAAGYGESALRHALRCQELIDENRFAFEDWDFAFAFDALARAYALTGDAGEAAHFREQAQAAGKAIVGDEEREIFQRWLSLGK